MVCHATKQELKEYILDVIKKSEHHGGFAFGTGNSIPNYVPTEGYLNMIDIVREFGETFAENCDTMKLFRGSPKVCGIGSEQL